MPITILPTQSKQKYVLDLLKSKSSLGDASFVSLSIYLNGLQAKQSETEWFNCAKALYDLSSSSNVEILKQVLRFPITTDQVLTFIQDMADHGWTLNDLPQRNQKEIELYHVLSQMLNIIQTPFIQWDKFGQLEDVSHIHVLDHLYSYPQTRRFEKAKLKGLKIIPIDSVDTVEKSVKFANNMRSEAQAAIQALLTSDLAYEDQSIVCLDPNLMDQVESFLLQYQIPYQKVGHGKTHPIFRFFSDVLVFKQNPNIESLIQLLHNDAYAMPFKRSLITYCETFKPDLNSLFTVLSHVEVAFNDHHLETLLTKRTYLSLEKEAEMALATIRESLQVLIETKDDSIEKRVTQCFDFVVSKVKLEDTTLSAVLSLKEHLENAQVNGLEGLDYWEDLVVYSISKLTLNPKAQMGVILTDLAHAMIPGLKRQIWLSCTQANYPQFKSHSGLFDDAYYLGIRGYDLKAEYTHHMESVGRLQKITPTIIYSYALGSYEGKAQRMPYELEKDLKHEVKSMRWDLVEQMSPKVFKQVQLETNLAQELYFKEGLKGSITSFEKFFSCPYQYFLNKGLGLYPNDSFMYERQAIGNLLHGILETSTKRYGKAYPKQARDHIDELLAPYIQSLQTLFPHQNQELKVLHQKAKMTILLSLEFLDDRESSTPYAPVEAEYEFKENLILKDGRSLELKGKIDRIDAFDTSFIILDYKSSVMSFSEPMFMVGLKLQLATYLWAYAKQGFNPKGAFYFGFTPEKVELETRSDFDETQERIKARRMNGLLLTEETNLDETGSHLKGWTYKKDSPASTYMTKYDYSKIITELTSLYSQMAQDLKAGNLTKQNKGSSCLYCDYRHFCQFDGPKTLIPKIESSVIK